MGNSKTMHALEHGLAIHDTNPTAFQWAGRMECHDIRTALLTIHLKLEKYFVRII